MSESVIARIDQVDAGYGDIEILHQASLDVARGKLTTIIGANGAGKSTLLKLLFGLIPARRGRIWLEGRDVSALASDARYIMGVSLVPQGRCNFPLMTVADNLRLGGFAKRIQKAALAAEIDRLVTRFPVLGTRWRTLAGNLSGGEQQILEMAMVLISAPDLLLLDEPSLGLSPKMMDVIFGEIRALVDEGVSVLMVEQNALQALACSDLGVVLEVGRVSLVDRADAILEHPEIRRLFLGL